MVGLTLRRARMAATLAAWLLAGSAAAADGEPRVPSIKFDGRLLLQHDVFDGVFSEAGQRLAATYPRRARIGISGRLPGQLKYSVDVDFDRGGEVMLKTAELAWRGWPAGTLRGGRFDPDFGLEHATSSNWTTGIERSAIWDLAPDVADIDAGYGVQFDHTGEQVYGSAGAFRWPDAHGLVARFVYAPVLAERRLVHLGVSLAGQQLDDGDGRIRTRLGVRDVSEHDSDNRVTLARKLGGDRRFDSQRLADLEFAAVYGSLSLQAEALQRRMKSAAPTRVANGYYAQVAWTLTGEARRYDIDGAKFLRPKPANARLGVWEVFVRHDRLRVRGESGLLGGGRNRGGAQANVFGVNWYANEWLRLSVNVLRARTDGIVNDVDNQAGNAYSLRLQMVF